MKPSDPDTFVQSVMVVLSDYPAGLVAECVDPRRGVARKLKFLSIAELVEWLDARLAHYEALANHVARPAPPPPPVFSEEHKAGMRVRLAELFRHLAHGPDAVEILKRRALK